jgi:hypothetical protein
MKQFYLLFAMIFGFATIGNAQNTVTVNASTTQFGYANVFELPANGGGYVFGQPWGVEDMKTVVDAGANTITLQPNFSAWDIADPFWVDPMTGLGNKTFEGNTYVEDNTLVGSELTFEGGCEARTIDAGYNVVAFIKVFNADFSVLKLETTTLTAGQNFSVTYTDVAAEDTTIQYGFWVSGINADPATETALGSVVVGSIILGLDDVNSIKLSTFPNPVSNVWNIQAEETITKVEIHNLFGQSVFNASPKSLNYEVNMSYLDTGVYMANISTERGSKTIKLIKK